MKNALPLSEAVEPFKGADFYGTHNANFERSFSAASRINLGPWVCAN